MATAKTQQDFWKSFAEFKAPAIDMNSAFNTYRRNLEVFSAVNQKLVETAQTTAKRQAETLRENVEQFITATKDILTSNSPEANTTKQINLMKSWYENTLNNAREVTESLTKSGTDAYAIINKRATESWEEFKKATNS